MLLLNADLGESWYTHRIGDDAALLPYLDCCNLACGFHGGDALTLQHTIELATHHGVAIGAHPSFPDRKHFGRQPMHLSPDHALEGTHRCPPSPPQTTRCALLLR